MKKPKLKKNPHSRQIARKFEELVDVMYTLRSEGGCPWDRAQTLDDLRQYLLEEAYEVLQTLDEENESAMSEELGDLLLQVVFLAQIMQERRSFTLLEVLDHILSKMIARHPHVFGTVKAESPDAALASWESMKSQETVKKTGKRRSLLEGVPLHLPALLQAHLISAKVGRVGFDWKREKDVWRKFREELKEFQLARSHKHKEEEMGDMLFTLANIARKNKINPEDALRRANAKFRKRFNMLEERVRAESRDWKELGLKDLDAIWDRVKKE